MKRVLVPLDGSPLATHIIPDARRLAGPMGEIVLVRDATQPAYDPISGAYGYEVAIHESDDYLDGIARTLRENGVNVQVQTLVLNDVPHAINEAVRLFRADIVAVATHGRSPLGRLTHGGVAWRMLTCSDAPVLLRHVEADDSEVAQELLPVSRRILVPLDGSPLAESAIAYAVSLALEWCAPIFLAQVTPSLDMGTRFSGQIFPLDYGEELKNTRTYLDTIAMELPVETHTHVFTGNVVDELSTAVEQWGITDVVMGSHGRSGLSRVILGSVADGLVHRLRSPVLVIPAPAAKKLEVEAFAHVTA